MLRGLYEFRPINEKTLGFQMNDLLLFLEPHARDKNWLRVADANGQIGFVPINFIEIHRATTSEKLLTFLDEAIRRARRDRLHTIDLLGSVRQNIMTSPYTTEEHMTQIEREVSELRSRSISELNYEEDYRRSTKPPKDKHSSPRPGSYSMGGLGNLGGLESRSPDHQSSKHHPHCSQKDTSSSSHFYSHRVQPHFHETDQDFISGDGIILPDSSDHLFGRIAAGGEALKQSKSRKKHKKQPEGSSGVTHYAEIVLPSASHPIVESYGNGKGVLNPVIKQEPTLSQKNAQMEKEISSFVSDPLEPLESLVEVGRRCSTQHCQRSVEHNCCCSPSKGSCGMLRSRFRPPGSPLDTITMAAEIVDIVRNCTGLSHKLSQDAAQVVLQYVSENIVDMPEELTKLMLHLESPRAISQNPSVISRSPDAYNIRKIFNRLTECKDDEQQRSWALHEDEIMILENLENLRTILSNADASISKYVMQSDRYNSVNALALYYQMETRWSIRAKLVDCFAVMCNIDAQAMSLLLNSILPMELAREIRESENNASRMCLCAGLLVMLLSSGENMPISHYDHLGGEFLEFVLAMIENPPDQEDKITDGFMNLLFAYNLQFDSVTDNLIISTLEEKLNANVFTQKVIYFLNREVDPIDVFDHPRETRNSVLKLTTDVFSSKKVADLFYTNDIKVLIDIVTRCVTDLGPGDKRRTSYLKLIKVIVRNSNFAEHKHRLEDLHNCFMSILLEEDHLALPDQKIIREVAAEFPAFFKTD